MDQTQLEKVFPSSSKIRSIYAFVRGCLREDVKPIKFILCKLSTSQMNLSRYWLFILEDQPPKRDLKVSDASVRDLTLSQLQLAPSSVLLIRFEDDALNRTSNQWIHRHQYFVDRSTIDAHIPAPLAAFALAQAVDLPLPPMTEQAENGNAATRPSNSNTTNTTATKGDIKVPKWLKLGQS